MIFFIVLFFVFIAKSLGTSYLNLLLITLTNLIFSSNNNLQRTNRVVSTSGSSGMENIFKSYLNNLSNIKNKELVNSIFSQVADNYDLMNDVLSLGLHRIWKKQFVNFVNFKDSDVVLDLAGGSGDITSLIKESNPKLDRIFVSDINKHMLGKAKRKLENKNVKIVCHSAEKIPFRDNQFNYVLVAFGIRNFSDIELSLEEIYRILKNNGKFMCLEFSKINRKSLRFFFKIYCDIIPYMGKYVANNQKAYKYLVDSINAFPNQVIFSKMLNKKGFKRIECFDLLDGLASIHIGEKI